MIIIEPGHKYLLDNYDGDPEARLELTFMKRVGDKYPGNESAHPGTNSQEVLRAEIDRAKYVNKQIHCDETTAILQHMRMALLLFEQRAVRRRNYNLPSIPIHSIENIQTCSICGHIYCLEHHVK